MNQLSFKNKKILIDDHEIKKVMSINICKEGPEVAEVILKFKAKITGLDNG